MRSFYLISLVIFVLIDNLCLCIEFFYNYLKNLNMNSYLTKIMNILITYTGLRKLQLNFNFNFFIKVNLFQIKQKWISSQFKKRPNSNLFSDLFKL